MSLIHDVLPWNSLVFGSEASGWRRVGPPRPPRRRLHVAHLFRRRGRVGQPGVRTRSRVSNTS